MLTLPGNAVGLLQLTDQHLPGTGVIIDHQHGQSVQQLSRLPIVGNTQFDGKVKSAAYALFRINRYSAVHQLHQILANGQPQPGATKLACG